MIIEQALLFGESVQSPKIELLALYTSLGKVCSVLNIEPIKQVIQVELSGSDFQESLYVKPFIWMPKWLNFTKELKILPNLRSLLVLGCFVIYSFVKTTTENKAVFVLFNVI